MTSLVKILKAEFIRSCVGPEQFPTDPLREIAVVGRSNVGKSSLINSLLQRKGLAKVSRTPGKTRAINLFTVVTDDPQVRARGMLTEAGSGARRRVFVRQPVRIAGRTTKALLPVPAVGEHTRSSLAAAGLTRTQIARLFASGVAFESAVEKSERASRRVARAR